MKIKYIFFFFCFCFSKSFSQAPNRIIHLRDSLATQLANAKTDSLKAVNHFKLVQIYMMLDTVQAGQHLKAGEKLIKRNTFLEGLYQAQLGFRYYYNQDLEKSKMAYGKADSALQKYHVKESYTILSDVWNNLAVIEQLEGRDDNYTNFLINKAIPNAEKANDKGRTASLYSSLGLGFMNLEQYNEAIFYLKKAEEILIKKPKESYRLVSVWNRLAENYLIQDKLGEAKKTLDQLALKINEDVVKDQNGIFYMNLGLYHHKLKEFKKAIDYFNKGIEVASGPNADYHIEEINMYKLKSLLANKQFNETILLGKQLEQNQDLIQIDQNKSEIFRILSAAYAEVNNFTNAYIYLKKKNDVQDKLNKLEIQTKINEYEAKFKNKLQEKELHFLKNEQQEVSLKLKNSKLYTALALAGMTIMLLVVFLIFGYYKNSKKMLLQKEIIHEQKNKETEKAKQLALTRAILSGQEKERERIAKDLHDSLGGMLSSISTKFSTWDSKFLGEEGRDEFQKNKEQLDNAISELRNISRSLMPETLLKYGLRVALSDLCDFYHSQNMKIDFQWYAQTTEMSLSNQLHIYRIVQELLSNVLKHAKASHVLVQCSENESVFYITVEDNGLGFYTKNKFNNGMGLLNLEKRVEFLKGKLEITSALNEGTSVNIEIKLEDLENEQ